MSEVFNYYCKFLLQNTEVFELAWSMTSFWR